MLPTRDPPQNKWHTQTESEGLEKIFQANGQEKKRGGVEYLYKKNNKLQNKGIKREPEGNL